MFVLSQGTILQSMSRYLRDTLYVCAYSLSIPLLFAGSGAELRRRAGHTTLHLDDDGVPYSSGNGPGPQVPRAVLLPRDPGACLRLRLRPVRRPTGPASALLQTCLHLLQPTARLSLDASILYRWNRNCEDSYF